MVVDTDSYDVLLGLDLLIKIGTIVDVEQGLIQVRIGPGADVEVLPLTMVNLMQRSDSATSDHKDDWRLVSGNLEVMSRVSYLFQQATSELLAKLESKSDSDSSESSEEATQLVDHDEDASEFGGTEFEELVKKEGPHQILQLTMQTNADDFMKEELTNADDYADWIQWANDEERRMQSLSEVTILAEESVLLQVQRMEINDSDDRVEERIMKNPKEETQWGEICQKIRIDQHLDKGMEQQLWSILEQYQDVFAWNKGELGCCNIGEHIIDTQGFPPCKVALGRLSYWQAEVNRQINVLVELGKMRPNNLAYACCVTLPVKKDGSRRFCGDYRPLNLQTQRNSFPMPLVENVISQLGKSAWFTMLDMQSGFW